MLKEQMTDCQDSTDWSPDNLLELSYKLHVFWLIPQLVLTTTL